MLYIVAGNNNEYRNWVAEQKKFHPSETRYVSNVDQIRGMSDIEGRFIGTCYDRIDIVEIVNRINIMRFGKAKPIVLLESLRHLSAYEVIDRSSTTTIGSIWSANNIPISNGGTAASRSYPSSMSGKTASTAIFDEVPLSYKVSLNQNCIDSFVLVTAKLYKSYITNTFNVIDNTIEYYFTNKQEALAFASKYDAVALEYK